MIHDNGDLLVGSQGLYLIRKLTDKGCIIMDGDIRHDIDRKQVLLV